MTNIVSLFAQRKQPKEYPPADVTSLILMITEWAEERGIDVYNDPAFHIRVADLMAQLKILAKEQQCG